MTLTRSVNAIGKILALAMCAMIAKPALASAQQASIAPAPNAKDARKPKALTVSPAFAPVPALKYRLIPSSADLNPGDAAAIYLRLFAYEWGDARHSGWKQVSANLTKWQNLPLTQFPVEEARTFVNLWDKQTAQLHFGARRKSCDWNYTLDEQRLDAPNIALPDVQAVRDWGRVLAIKAHVEIAEGKLDAAIRTIETGLAFGGHVAAGPWVINNLVGLSIKSIVLTELDVLIERPDSPNLFWALTALPRPFMNVRNAMEMDGKVWEIAIPELSAKELAQPRSAAEWSAYVARMHAGIVRWSRDVFQGQQYSEPHPLKTLADTDLALFKAKALPEAREFLKKSIKMTDQQLAEMSSDQLVALYIGNGYRTLCDSKLKAIYLPPLDALLTVRASNELDTLAKTSSMALFAQVLTAVEPILLNELRLDAHVSALRAIEALRMYAAAHNGKLPESLSQITEVPVPENPITGKAFEYELKGGTATLSAVGPVLSLQMGAPVYTITIRK